MCVVRCFTDDRLTDRFVANPRILPLLVASGARGLKSCPTQVSLRSPSILSLFVHPICLFHCVCIRYDRRSMYDWLPLGPNVTFFWCCQMDLAQAWSCACSTLIMAFTECTEKMYRKTVCICLCIDIYICLTDISPFDRVLSEVDSW